MTRGNPRRTTSLGTAALWQEDASGPVLWRSYDSTQATTNHGCPDKRDAAPATATWLYALIFIDISRRQNTRSLLCYALCSFSYLFYLDATRFSPQTWSTSARSRSMPLLSHLLCWLYAMIRSAFARIAVFSYDIRSFTHIVLILLVSFLSYICM